MVQVLTKSGWRPASVAIPQDIAAEYDGWPNEYALYNAVRFVR